MCLLVALFRKYADCPLVLAANRDEALARPATPMTVLHESGPRLLGGRDLLAGGTWMAIGEHGVVAALTNVPSPGGRDATKKSRGELPIRLAMHASAAEAAAAFVREIDPADYNRCWLLVGDRDGLFYIDLLGATARMEVLPPGLYVLENQPLRPTSIKARFVEELVRAALPAGEGAAGDALVAPLASVLSSHALPPREGLDEALAKQPERPLPTYAPCVHAGPVYGTRSSSVVIVPASADPPRVFASDGPSCTAPLRDESHRWS